MKDFFKKFIPIIFCSYLIAGKVFSQLQPKPVIPAADRVIMYKPLLKNKILAVVANQTSMVGKKHLVDTLLSLGANIKKIFVPEHGF
ncbi:MAG TPA: DUF1343 domain-containing protein, partial [Bacteroidales bacterium]